MRVLLTGTEWVGDVLGGCQRGLEQLGLDVMIVVGNEPTKRVKELNAVRRRAAALPVIGPRCARVIGNCTREYRTDEVRRAVRDALRDWKPDVLIALVDGLSPVLPDVLDEAPHVRKVGWVLDDPFYYNAPARFDLYAFDVLYVVEDSLIAPLIHAAGRPVSCVPLGADPATYNIRATERSEEHNLAFVGKSYFDNRFGLARRNLLSRISRLGLSIWGDRGWTTVSGNGVHLGDCYRGGPVRSVETNQIYNRSKIVINILHPQIRLGTSLRTFAIGAAGACQLVEWRPGLENLLEPGREVLVYRCADELEEEARRYLGDARARNAIAAAGYRRVINQHTYAHRLRDILTDIDLRVPRWNQQSASADTSMVARSL